MKTSTYDEVSQNDYNLSVSTYAEAVGTRMKMDITKLNAQITEIVAREQVLRDAIDKIIAGIEIERVYSYNSWNNREQLGHEL